MKMTSQERVAAATARRPVDVAPARLIRHMNSRFRFLVAGAMICAPALSYSVAASAVTVIENDRLRAGVSAEQGAALMSLVGKEAGAEMLAGASATDTLVREDRTRVSLSDTLFQRGPAAADQAEFSCAPAALPGLKILKRYRLPAGADALYIDYELSNTGDAPLEVCLATRFRPMTAGKAPSMAVPTSLGAATFPAKSAVLPLGGAKQRYLYDLDGAWAALLEQGGAGVLSAADPRHLSYLYVNRPAQAFEFGRTVVTLAPKQVFRTTNWIMPIEGFTRVSGAAMDVAGGFTISPAAADGSPPLTHQEFSERMVRTAASEFKARTPKTFLGDRREADDLALLEDMVKEVSGEEDEFRGAPIRINLKLQAAQACRAEAVWSVRSLTGGAWRSLGHETVALPAGRAIDLVQTFKPEKPGSYVLRVELREGKQARAVFEQPLVAGEARGIYKVTPPAPEGKVFEGFRPSPWVPSHAVTRPHVSLARPLASGAVRMLLSTPYLASRGLVEIEQRLEVTTDFVTAGRQYKMQGAKLRARAGESLHMRQFLARSHDVIVLVEVDSDFFPVDLVDEMLRQVRENGTGLVLVHCEDPLGVFEPLLNEVKSTTGDAAGAAARLRPGFPSLVTGAFGKGRVALVPGARPYAKPDWYGQNETQVQGLIRTIDWAARGLPKLALEASATPRKVARKRLATTPYSVSFRNESAEPFRGTLRVHVRRDLLRAYPSIYSTGNAFAYRPVAGWETALPAREEVLEASPQGRGRVDVTLPALAAGEYNVDLQVLNGDDAVVVWHRLPLTVTSPARIVSAELSTESDDRTLHADFTKANRPWFGARASDTLKLNARIADAGVAVKARLQAYDPWGRTAFDQTVTLRKAGQETLATFVQPLHSCIHMISVVKLSLLDAEGDTLSEERLVNFIYPRADRLPAFELRGYAEVRVNNAVSGYDVRVGGASPFSLAWHGVRKSDYGSAIGGSKILAAGDVVLNAPPDLTSTDELALGATRDDVVAERRVGQVVDPLGLDEPTMDRKQAYFRIPCFNNPEDRRRIVDGVRRSYTANSRCYPFKGFLTDEFWYSKEDDPNNTTSGFRRAFVPDRDLNICRCRHCAAAFIAYARERFQDDLSRLNTVWNTTFKQWEDVEIPLTVAEGSKAPSPDMWPYVLAHRAFIEDQVADLVGELSQTVKSVDPECETGMSGLWKTGIHTGINVYRLARLVKHNMLYSDIDMWTDFGNSDAVNWTGYGAKYAPFMGSATIWRALTAGRTGIAYYGKESNPMHRPDFTFYEEPAYLFAAVRTLKDRGLDRLVVRHRTRDPIAMYYSSRDVSLAQLEDWTEDPRGFIGGMRNGGRGYSEFVHSVITSYRALCNARYLQPFWTASAQLEAGNFGDRFGTPRLLLLPYAQCLSPRQAETIRQFVREGGVLVGDVHTGWRDGHGKLQPQGALDDVFGIARQGEYHMRRRANLKGAAIPVTFGEHFGTPFRLAFGAVGPGDVKAVTATPWASFTLKGQEQPAFMVNEFGKGRAIYLNFIPAGYAAVEVTGEGEEQDTKALQGEAARQFQQFLGKILEIARIRAPLEFTSARRLSVGRFGEDDVSHLAVVAHRSAKSIEADYRIKIPEKRHVYSARLQEYLGFTDEFPIRLRVDPRMMGDVYSLLPYQVAGLAVESPPLSVKAGERLSFTVRVLPAAAQRHRHVIALRVLDPDQRDVPWYRFSTETVNGAATGFVDTAAGDTPGTWTLVLTDAASGVEKSVPFTVLAP